MKRRNYIIVCPDDCDARNGVPQITEFFDIIERQKIREILFIFSVVASIAALEIVVMVLVRTRSRRRAIGWRTIGRRRTRRRALILGRRQGRFVLGLDEYCVLAYLHYPAYGNKRLALVRKLKALASGDGESYPTTFGKGYRNIADFAQIFAVVYAYYVLLFQVLK